MIILTSQLLFETSGQRLLYSVVYDDESDRFVRTCQWISAELGTRPWF
jgi:5'(3')-deoxyribonucleotidase